MAGPLQALRRMSGTKIPNDPGSVAPTQLNREKGLWNFLTWSFFIAQVLAAEKFFASSAQAADAQDPNSSSLASQFGDNPNKYLEPFAGLRRSEADDSSNGRHDAAGADAALKVALQAPNDGHFSNAAAIGKATDPASGLNVFVDGDGDRELQGRSEGTSHLDDSALVGLPLSNDIAAGVIDLDVPLGQLIDSSLSTVTNLADSTIDGLDHVLESVAGTIDDVGQSVLPLVDQTLTHLLDSGLPLSPVTTAVNSVIQGTLDTAHDIVGSAGNLAFAAAPAVENIAHDLFVAGSYTPLGLVLGAEPPGGSPTGITTNLTGPVQAMVEHILGSDPGHAAADEAQTLAHNITTLPSHLDTGLLHGFG